MRWSIRRDRCAIALIRLVRGYTAPRSAIMDRRLCIVRFMRVSADVCIVARTSSRSSAMLARRCWSQRRFVRCSRARPPIDFTRDVRPILADNCFHCHGPDAGRAAGRPAARCVAERGRRPRRRGRRYRRGKPDESELIARITSDDPDVRMPPADSGKIAHAGADRNAAAVGRAGGASTSSTGRLSRRSGRPCRR